MKMIKLSPLTLVLTTLILCSYLVSCSTSKHGSYNMPCNVEGSYSGTYTNQFSQQGSFAYKLADHNFMSGGEYLSSEPTAFGSYSTNCNDIQMKSWNSINGSYYYFEGKFSEDRKTITGTYRNLTTKSEHGSFRLVKQ